MSDRPMRKVESVVFIADLSGSMGRTVAMGGTKLAAAKVALQRINDFIPTISGLKSAFYSLLRGCKFVRH